MDPPLFAKKTNTLLWITNDLFIIASQYNCYLKSLFTSRSFKLHNEPAHDIILNNNKTKIGLFCQKSFVVYDVPMREKIWSLPIAYSDNYSATFSPTDEIILYHKGKVTINNKQSLLLPFIEPDASFGITCNCRTKEIVYPSSNNTFARKSLMTDRIIRHSRIINDNGKKYVVYSALYSPYGPHIALHTYEKNSTKDHPSQKIFLLHSTTNEITKIQLTYNTKEETTYYQATFLPYSSLIAVLCKRFGIHFWDFVQQKEMWIEVLTDRKGPCKTNNNVLDFCSNAVQYVAIIERSYFIKQIPQPILLTLKKNHILFIYLSLQQYSRHNDNLLPNDIMQLLVQYLHAVYKL